MKIRLLSLLSLFFVSRLALNAQSLSVVDTIWGTPVADPYRWLEDLNSDTVKAWLKQQQLMTKSVSKKFAGYRFNIEGKIATNGGFHTPRVEKENGYYFRMMYTSDNTTPVLFYRKSYNGFEMEAYNPNKSYKEPVTIEGYELSKDARYLAVMLSKSGTDWRTIKMRDLKNKKDLPDQIDWVKFSNIAWTDSGFFYSRFQEPPADLVHIAPNAQQELRFHKLGTSQEQDVTIYRIPQEAKTVFHFETKGDYLLLYSALKMKNGWYNAVLYQGLKEGLFAPQEILFATQENDIDFQIISFNKNTNSFVAFTDYNAPRGQIVECPVGSTNQFELLIPQYKETLDGAMRVGDKYLCKYFNNGKYGFVIHDSTGNILNGRTFPVGVNVSGLYKENDSIVVFFENSYFFPPVVYTYNINTNSTKLVDKTSVYYDAERYDSEIVFYKSKDGTEIPMYITCKKGLKRSSENPVLIQAYGGYGVSMKPYFDYSNIILFENNGILAVPLIRGGGELGKEWHTQGSSLNKQNSFDDVIAAAEYLIKNGYTSKERLAVNGGSNGGLMVGAVITQRPNLFKVAIGEVGVYDMLRYHHFTMGRIWENEYGNISDSTQFRNLLQYSPLHNIQRGTKYPATLLITSENDDRVPPLHTYKFLQTLQENSRSGNPYLLYFEEDAGHNGSVTLDKRSRKEAFILAFMFDQMGIIPYTSF